MSEFRELAEYAIRDLDLPDELRKEVVKSVAKVLFWDRRLTFNYVQQELGILRVEIENQVLPINEYSDYTMASEVDRIRKKFRGEAW